MLDNVKLTGLKSLHLCLITIIQLFVYITKYVFAERRK